MDETIAKAIPMTKYRSVESKIRDVMEKTAADYMKSEMSEAVANQNEAVISPDEFVPPDQNPKYLAPTKDKPKMSRISRGLKAQRAMKIADD